MKTQVESREFLGKWITSPEFEHLKPINVFHRQLDKSVTAKSTFENKHVLFRKNFMVDDKKSSVLFMTADDYYKLYINGTFVTQGPCPGYPFNYYYNCIDVTDYLRKGENTIAVHTYYQGLINRVWVSGDDRHGLLLDLTIDHQTVLKSDESFLCAAHTGFTAIGKSGYETQFMEKYDSNVEEVGFERVDYDDGKWKNAVSKKHTDYRLCRQPTKQLSIHPIKPISLLKTDKGYIADFGSQYVGYVLLEAVGKKGGTVIIRCGQELNADGSVRFELRANCRYHEEWILSGGTDTLNQYDYKTFRYVELLLPEGCAIDEDSFRLSVRHYPFTLKASCNTNDPELLRVWDLCVNSIHYGVQEVIQDCMDREKGQYLGDGFYSSIAHALLTKDTAIMEKLIDDALRSAFINKGLMTCSPCSFMQEIAEYSLMLPILVLAHFRMTKNMQYVRDNYQSLLDVIEFYRSSYATETGLIGNLDKWCVVEWPPPAQDGYDFDLSEGKVCHGVHNAINAYYIGAIKAVNALAGILGETSRLDVSTLERAFVDAFYDESTGLFTDSEVSTHSSMAANAYALWFGLCPNKRSEDAIVKMIDEKRLSASMFYVTFAMLAGLKRIGNNKLCNELLADEGGWLRMIREGATNTFEGWGKDSKWNTSLFHLTFTYPIIFLTDWGMEDLF